MKVFWILAVCGIVLASCTSTNAKPTKNEEDIKEEEKSWLERMKEKYADKIKAVVDRLKVLAKEAIDEAAAAAIRTGKDGFNELAAKKKLVESTDGEQQVDRRSIDLENLENNLKEKIEEIKEKYGRKVKDVLKKFGVLEAFTLKTFKDAALELLAEKAAESTWAILGKRDVDNNNNNDEEEQKDVKEEEKSWIERMKEKYADKIKAVVDRLKVLAKEAIDEAAAAAIRTGKEGLIELVAKNGLDAIGGGGGLGKRNVIDFETIDAQLREKLNAIKTTYGDKVTRLLEKFDGIKEIAGKAFKDAAIELLAEHAAESTWKALGRRDLKSFVDKAKCEYNKLRVLKCMMTGQDECPPEVFAMMQSDKPLPGC